MATLYFHIPFCKRICTYCDFYKVGAIELMPRTLDAMHSELASRAKYLSNRCLTSIYFGGGTPSLIAPEEIERLISHARRLFDCSAVEEITLEANPDDLTEEYIARLSQTSINRISLGIQSFDDGVLKFMNRRHTAAEAKKCVGRLRRAGYDNISIDIIFGVAGFGEGWLMDTLREAIALDVEHISAYHLTVEERTRLGVMVRKGEYQPVSEEQSESDYRLVEDMLTAAGYEHYEVSNYAKEGRRAKHNSASSSDIETMHIILDGKAEALEFKIKENSPISNIKIEDLKLKKNIIISCITRKGEIIIPRGKDIIKPGDNVIVVTLKSGFKSIDDILE
jgi:oxygen-independent coproporphyrinogen-3 oxidase